MAEAFGIFVGVVGIVPLVKQLVTGIKTLRRIRNSIGSFTNQLDDLIGELEFLQKVLERVETIERGPGGSSSSHPVILQQCRRDCANVFAGLERLHQRFPVSELSQAISPPDRRIFAQANRIMKFRDWEKEIQSLHKAVQKAKQDLLVTTSLMSMCRSQATYEGIMLVMDQLPNPSTMQEIPHTDGKEQPSSAELPPQPITGLVSSRRPQRPANRRQDCSIRRCSCRCHIMGKVSRRLWSFDYTPLSIMLQGCNKAECSALKYSISFRVALTQLGFPIATIFQLQFLDNGGKFSIRPGLDIQCVVPNTSPGFELIWKLQTCQIEYEEAASAFRRMYRSNPKEFLRHINARGSTYVKEVALYPWGLDIRHYQFELLRLFMVEFGMIGGTDDMSFLYACLRGWVGEGPHMGLFEALLDNHWDIAELDHPQAIDWPEPCDPNWISEMHVEDPFFVTLLETLAKESPGYGGITPAHEIVLKKSFGVAKLLEAIRSNKGLPAKDFLGRTPLHFAASTNHGNTKNYIKTLLSTGQDIDAEDNHGITPLMYAAAMDSTAAVVALLEAGATITRDHLRGRTFLEYAIARENSGVLTATIETLKHLVEPEIAFWCAKHATVYIMCSFPILFDRRDEILPYLFGNIEDVNFTFSIFEDDNTTLMHRVRSPTEAQALIARGFVQFNHADGKGLYPIMEACKHANSEVVNLLLQHGADPNATVSWGHSALYHLLAMSQGHLGSLSIETDRCKMTRRILQSSGNPLAVDNCTCACSPGGCSPANAVNGSLFDKPESMWSLHLSVMAAFEWVALVFEESGPLIARKVLLSIIRRIYFADLGLEHTCCRETKGSASWSIVDSLTHSKKPMFSEEQVAIEPNSSVVVKSLSEKMELMSQFTVYELLEEWLRLLGCSYTALALPRLASEEFGCKKRDDLPGILYYHVDRKRDRFVENLRMSAVSENDVGDTVAKGIAKYFLGLEYRKSTIPNLPGDQQLANVASHRRRVAFAHRLSQLTAGAEAVTERFVVVAEGEGSLDEQGKDAFRRYFLEFREDTPKSLWE